MSYRVKWSPEAEYTYSKVLQHLVEEWSEKEIAIFIDRTEEVINFLQNNPKQYIYSASKKAYRAVISKQVSLYYRVHVNQIELLTFWDNRKDPTSLNLP